MIVPVQRRCSNCGEQFERSLFGINLIMTRYERCPHCKKWARYRRFGGDVKEPESPAEADALPGESDEDRLRRRIEESRYEKP